MAYAYRRAASSQPDSPATIEESQICLHGTYSMDCKVTVEWTLDVPLRDFVQELSRFLTVPRSSSSVRSFVSSLCRSRIEHLPHGRISGFRASRSAVAGSLQALARLRVVDVDDDGNVHLVRE